MNDEKRLSAQELADRERVALQTVYQWNRKRIGPPYLKIGRQVLYELGDVEQWEGKRKRGSGEPRDT